MATVDEMDAFGMLREDWGSAYEITRTAGAEHPYRGGPKG
jgi:hypothetical protein